MWKTQEKLRDGVRVPEGSVEITSPAVQTGWQSKGHQKDLDQLGLEKRLETNEPKTLLI